MTNLRRFNNALKHMPGKHSQSSHGRGKKRGASTKVSFPKKIAGTDVKKRKGKFVQELDAETKVN